MMMDAEHVVGAGDHAGHAAHGEISGPHPQRLDIFTTWEDDADTRFVYVPGDLLVATADVQKVKEFLFDVGCSPQDEDGVPVPGLQRWHTPRVDAVRYVVDRCRSMEEKTLPAVSANIVSVLGSHNVRPCATPPVPAGAPEIAIAKAGVPRTPAGTGPGSGVRVGLIDSGVADGHSWVNERCAMRPGLVDVEDRSEKPNGMLHDAAAHGLFAAGLIIRKAPGVTIVPRREVRGGFISDWDLAKALLALGGEDVDLVHLSLGGFTPENVGLPATARALQSLAETNPDLVVVASAGNDGVDRPHFPAAFKGVVAVGALNATGQAAEFSNHGPWVDACATGVDVVSTFYPGELVPPMASSLASQDFKEGWASWSGASHAAAQVTGAIAARMNSDPDDPIRARRAVFELLTAADSPQVPGLGTRIAY